MRKLSSSEIYEIGSWLFDSMSECRLCPMECAANRLEGETGNCNSTDRVKVASCNLHFGEEPPLSGGGGSGTIFFSNCSLFCKYCQNYPISQMGAGSEVSIGELSEMMLQLQRRGAENINFVTPDHMLPMILMALAGAKNKGLVLPVVYNCSGYEKIEILKQLDGIIDIYLADMRYNDNDIAKRLSGCENYVTYNQESIKEMYRQVGNLKMNKNGLAESGLIIRHLVLPNQLSGSEGIFKFLAEEISKEVYISLMSQYFPAYKASKNEDLKRRITGDEFQIAVDAFYANGLKNGYIQHMDYEKSY
jgi:putative pyruvate formate lyase activating enzyme